MKLKKGDRVLVVKGKDKGKTERIEKVFSKENKVLLLGVNTYKRHVKGNIQGQQSDIKTIVKPLPVTSVQIICPKCNKPTRVGYLTTKNKKERICRKCKRTI